MTIFLKNVTLLVRWRGKVTLTLIQSELGIVGTSYKNNAKEHLGADYRKDFILVD